MTVIEKVAYLRGLADGLKLTDTSAEGKVLLNVIEVLDDLALSVTDLEDAVEELGEVVDAIDDDLQDVEDALYEDEDETTTSMTTMISVWMTTMSSTTKMSPCTR